MIDLYCITPSLSLVHFWPPNYAIDAEKRTICSIVNNFNESVHRKEQLASRINNDTVQNVDFIIIIIIKLYLYTDKSGTAAPFTGVYKH